ncbi:disease resistance protein PIK6-NP-like [Curcuma longa]|uniref:disease resistance protein PIK6-NP-like n=1 Tax=Curcuma longa TaxID=136217 RepID=UPI003D9E5DE9
MATMMAMKVVDFSFQSVAGKLEKMLEEEAALLAGVEDDVRYIVAELKSIIAFLTDMSTRRNLNERMQNWVREVREVANDAEDSIDEFECRLRSTPCDELGVKGLFMCFCRCLKSLKARHGVASELKKLKIEVEEIRKRHDRYSHPNEAASYGTATSLDMADRYSDPRIIGHFVEEAQLVGINQSRDMLIKWVMDENYPELTMISLVGFGGLGKTTLAKTIYDDPSIVGGHFQSRTWIAVSQNYNIKELLKKII